MKELFSFPIIWLTLTVAMILQILPLPEQFVDFRPNWLLASVFYWCIALPLRFNVLGAFICGLSLDLLLGSTLGIRGLSFAVIGYVGAINCVRIRNFSLWQQAIGFALICVVNKAIIFWINFIIHDVHWQSGYLYSALSSMIIWPWIYLLLRKVRQTLIMES